MCVWVIDAKFNLKRQVLGIVCGRSKSAEEMGQSAFTEARSKNNAWVLLMCRQSPPRFARNQLERPRQRHRDYYSTSLLHRDYYSTFMHTVLFTHAYLIFIDLSLFSSLHKLFCCISCLPSRSAVFCLLVQFGSSFGYSFDLPRFLLPRIMYESNVALWYTTDTLVRQLWSASPFKREKEKVGGAQIRTQARL